MIKAGEKMSDKVVAFIKRNTTPTERKSFLPKHGYKSETINAVFRGDRDVTESNMPLFKDLLRRAKKNLKKDIELSESIE